MSIQDIINFFVGKKTYIIGTVAILYGIFYNDPNAVWIGLAAWGLKAGQSESAAQVISNK